MSLMLVWSRDAESMHAVAKVWAVVPEVTRVNSMAPMNGAVAGTWEGVEKGVGIGWQCRMRGSACQTTLRGGWCRWSILGTRRSQMGQAPLPRWQSLPSWSSSRGQAPL